MSTSGGFGYLKTTHPVAHQRLSEKLERETAEMNATLKAFNLATYGPKPGATPATTMAMSENSLDDSNASFDDYARSESVFSS